MESRNAALADNLFDEARNQARHVGLDLMRTDEGLALSDGNMTLIAGLAHLAKRVKASNLDRELLVRAARLRGHETRPHAVDATAGLGEDAFILAAAGFSVQLFERNAVIAALLADALARAETNTALSPIAGRMELVFGDSLEALPSIEPHPDIVLLDPMFPGRQKSAAVKKKLQLLQNLESPCEDEAALLDAAFAARPRKVVVKRPAKGPYLAGRKPDYTTAGKAVRFDCYALPAVAD